MGQVILPTLTGRDPVLAAVRRNGVRALVCASSVAAYSPAPGGGSRDDRVDESWPTDGASSAAYCREKAYNERLMDTFQATTPETRLIRMRPAFVFQRSAASEQRRIFGGALLRPSLLKPSFVPVLPVPKGLRLQAVHAVDVARAIARAVTREVCGAFNLAADDVLRKEEPGRLPDVRPVEVPVPLARGAMEAGWRTRAVPVPGSLLTALMQVPLLSSARARDELGWSPRHTAMDSVAAMLSGAAHSAGSQMPPLHPSCREGGASLTRKPPASVRRAACGSLSAMGLGGLGPHLPVVAAIANAWRLAGSTTLGVSLWRAGRVLAGSPDSCRSPCRSRCSSPSSAVDSWPERSGSCSDSRCCRVVWTGAEEWVREGRRMGQRHGPALVRPGSTAWPTPPRRRRSGAANALVEMAIDAEAAEKGSRANRLLAMIKGD